MPGPLTGATGTPTRGLGHDFHLLAVGQGLSWLGSTFQPIALAVAILGSGRSVSMLGILLAVLVAAQMLWTLVGGVLADRFEARLVMITADLTRAAAVGGMAMAFATDHTSLLLLGGLMVVMGTGSAFFGPAMRAVKPIVVAPDQRKSANSLLSALSTGSDVVGPVLAGVLVGLIGAPFGFAVNAVSFLASAVAVSLIRVRVVRHKTTTGRSFRSDLVVGWQTVRSNDWLVWGIFSAAVLHIATGVLVVVVQVVAFRELGGAHALGLIAAAQGVGGVVGSLLAMRLRPRRPLMVGYLTLCAMPLWISSYVWSSELLVVMSMAALGFLGMIYFNIQWETAIQDHVPHDMMARVSSWDILTSFIGMPIGYALAGLLTDRFGLNSILLGGAVVLLFAGMFPLVARGTRTLEARPTVQAPTVVSQEAA
ncbi:MFS transporter [Leekyejoonella antrihumi]|nr:MFS transporter [Leekyejoonella antrihumi]